MFGKLKSLLAHLVATTCLALASSFGVTAFAGVTPAVLNSGEPDSAAVQRLNAVARLMAGAPGVHHPFAQSAAWKEHSAFMRTAWSRLNTRQVAAMSSWRDTELGRACPAGGTLMYPFSGPDFLNAHWLFPGCDTIVMFGLEHIGEVPNIDALGDRALMQLTADVRVAMSNFLDRNYFITDSMARQLRTHYLRGVLPVLMISMAMSDLQLVRITPLNLPSALEPSAHPAGHPMRQLKGITIEYTMPGTAAVQRLNYFSVDASDRGLAFHPEFLDYVRGLAPTTTFIKSASYLLQGSEFRQMRAALLDISDVIVQDDSGLPFALLETRGWRVQLHGRYGRPIPPFGGSFQVELSRAYKAQGPAPLPFTFGYQYHDRRDTRSNLIVAQRMRTGAARQIR
ncbi:MAG: hypothetical protein ABI630_02330 [Betaproteobacteria bacterium]